ncbi:uncharacterized protein EI97DRAFT_447532 [Westerdykella ornata]|uniref:Uncharacterized protein n=1 Tax=Westerdykella ornata TaxID=318751 RepID=A0A6A6JZH6_WESOR|nr:uncharacterized protein EI97DRAFT_447532 [Westerdykella ornata]KAF2281615.1 hypothetical protein EI97DRAFT_447532 [Westerdykella ornata]
MYVVYIRSVDDSSIGAASVSPSGRDVVLAGKSGLYIVDLDNPYSPPRHVIYRSSFDVADVQWSPFASRPGRIASTANQRAIVFNLDMVALPNKPPVEFDLHAHERAITDINFSAHNPDLLATCGVDSYLYTWDLRAPRTPAGRLKHNWYAAIHEGGATQVKWNRQNEHLIACSYDKSLRVYDVRKDTKPLTLIEAHTTKIYGIDWNRANANKIVTCSLDKTVKLWDNVGLEERITVPSGVIRCHFPVKRARHTPFPNGILVMAARGSAALNLYTHRSADVQRNAGITVPVHSFEHHEEGSQVLEFLWRSRGAVDDDGVDNREFQLISWGRDSHLHLYNITDDLLQETVGFTRGAPAKELPSTTRKGAKYVTYRDEPPKTPSKTRARPSSRLQQTGTITSTSQTPRETMSPGTIRSYHNARVKNDITWMHNVKIDEPTRGVLDYRTEVKLVSEKYPNAFEPRQGDLQKRYITLAFQGPWGELDHSAERKAERKLAFLRLRVRFPRHYPRYNAAEADNLEADEPPENQPLEIEFLKTTANIEEAVLDRLKADMNEIAHHRAMHGKEALEAIICYGLGERGLEDSLVISDEPSVMPAAEEVEEEESSSEEDEDDEGIGNEHQNEFLSSSLTNANVPRPIQTSTRFSTTGALTIARIHSTTSYLSPLASLIRLPRMEGQGLSREGIFESFGRLHIPRGYGSESPTSSEASWEWASTASSSSQSEEDHAPLSRFNPPTLWQNSIMRFQSKTSHPSSIGARAANDKSVVTILASVAEDFVPSKRKLAQGYWIFGDGPQVCSHNAQVARSAGYEDLGDVWELCGLILNNQVPLEILPQQHRREQVLVLARRALVRIKRKDSGLDLQFDEADTVKNPRLKARVKWGHHAIVTWLIPALFDHFERLADIQMLAMLSCIFSEPAAREGVSSAMATTKHSNLPMSMEAPAFSLDYFSSADAAWSLFKPTISIPPTPAHSRLAMPVNDSGWNRLHKALDTFGSHGSSNGPWGSDTVPSEPVTPYSTGTTPPNLSRAPTTRSTATHTPFSTSPEQPSHLKKSSTANFASAIATLSRPFANVLSSSPPVKNRTEGDLSTSAPTSGVTWGTTTFYNNNGDVEESTERSIATRAKSSKRASFGQADRINIDYYSDSDSDYEESGPYDTISEYTAPITSGGAGDDGKTIRVTLKNQDQFDDEGCVSAPLLDMSKEWLYQAWRAQYAELLTSWGLVRQRAEILKFNGLTSYFPSDSSRGTSKAGSLHLGLPGHNGAETPLPPALSRASSALAPPVSMTPQYRRSPVSSPKHFSFNPEATEFQPGGASFEPPGGLSSDLIAPPPDVFISSEQYLRLSIPTPNLTHPMLDDGATDAGGDHHSTSGAVNTPRSTTAPSQKVLRPGLRSAFSRGMSMRQPSSFNARERDQNDKEKLVVYMCSICWMRVGGRFFLCPGCGHVAHFECMEGGGDEGCYLHWSVEEGFEEGECVVGCGCGCGFEGFDWESSEGWEQRGRWEGHAHYEHEHGGVVGGGLTGEEIEHHRFEGGHGHGHAEEELKLGGSYSPKLEKKGRAGQIRMGLRRSASAR